MSRPTHYSNNNGRIQHNMDERELTIATWNIGGGILGESHQIDGTQDIAYHAGIVDEFRPDILCLQEAHEFDDPDAVGQTEMIARLADYPYHAVQRISRSHLAENAYLSLGVVSQFPLGDLVYTQFPNPGLSAQGPSGEKWVLFDKGYATCPVAVETAPISLTNAHCYPLHYFGVKPTDAQFDTMWTAFQSDLRNVGARAPSVVAVDLNYPDVGSLLGGILGGDPYHNAFSNTPTTPKGIQQDYLLYNAALRLLSVQVSPTQADHLYCAGRFAIETPSQDITE